MNGEIKLIVGNSVADAVQFKWKAPTFNEVNA